MLHSDVHSYDTPIRQNVKRSSPPSRGGVKDRDDGTLTLAWTVA